MHQQPEASGHNLPMVNVNVSRNNVLNRVTNQQDKWKRQVRHYHVYIFSILYSYLIIFISLRFYFLKVQEQRQRIYDRHSMLN